MATEKFLPYGRHVIDQDDINAVTEALKSDMLTRGPKVQEFEKAVAEFCGAEYAVAFNNGTSALSAAYFAGDLKPNDRVLTTPNSFFGTIAYPVQMGAKTVFIDIDPSTGNMDLELLGCNLFEPSTRSKTFVVPVHFAGIAVDMQKIQSMIRETSTIVIEDAAHAIGSSYPSGEMVGSCAYSDMTIFSFHPVKNITTGEGGMVTTNYKHIYDRLLLFRNNGLVRTPELQEKMGPWYYEIHAATGNYHLTDFQCALGLSQLKKLKHFAIKRRNLVSHYREELMSVPGISLFHPSHDPRTCYHIMVAQFDFQAMGIDRASFMAYLKEEGVGSQVHYIPLYDHPVMKKSDIDLAPYFPNMTSYYSKTLSLPLFPEMKKQDVKEICKIITKKMKAARR
jgi:UDP-4-amino-4,6-dideoxy-L-N-acetyl-beta-L-altrosamine transaminase